MGIELSASGDLADSINIKDKSFTLAPGKDKKAYFDIEVAKAGTTESQINVQFSPADGKNGVGLSSTVIVIAGGSDTDTPDTGDCAGDTCDISGIDVTPGDNSDDNPGMSKVLIVLLSTTGLVCLAFVVLIILAFTKKKKREIKLKRKVNKSE